MRGLSMGSCSRAWIHDAFGNTVGRSKVRNKEIRRRSSKQVQGDSIDPSSTLRDRKITVSGKIKPAYGYSN